MSAVLGHPRSIPQSLVWLWQSWRSLQRQELIWFMLLGLAYGLADLSNLAYVEMGRDWLLALSRLLLGPVLLSLVLLLFWLPAERSAPEHARRVLRLASATLLGTVAATAGLWLLTRGLAWPSVEELMRLHKGLPMYRPPHWSAFAGDCLAMLVPAGLAVALYELRARRTRARASLQHLLHEHSVLARRAMASRLAALQAQIEPQFLFDALVDIEQAYERSDAEAPAQMERLIRHLRVALPRLREQGGTLESEAELLQSYLAVVAGRRKREIAFHSRWPAALNGTPLPPMLLLPLLQRALRLAAAPPGRCSLDVAPLEGGGLRLRLAFDQAGLCGEDEELRVLAERLRALSGGPAELHCRDEAGGTLFILELKP